MHGVDQLAAVSVREEVASDDGWDVTMLDVNSHDEYEETEHATENEERGYAPGDAEMGRATEHEGRKYTSGDEEMGRTVEGERRDYALGDEAMAGSVVKDRHNERLQHDVVEEDDGGVNASNDEHMEKEGTAAVVHGDYGAYIIEPRECVLLTICTRAD